ncbi:hypothetical protein CW304_13350 [Bacillus sp. UFRGS-B20]|nr:hypothetical protein CW304_13350 [Bacillus sp. UFRGS-B20]
MKKCSALSPSISPLFPSSAFPVFKNFLKYKCNYPSCHCTPFCFSDTFSLRASTFNSVCLSLNFHQ